jgi:hypothetical protein
MTTRPDSARSICKEVGLSLSQWQKAKDAGIDVKDIEAMRAFRKTLNMRANGKKETNPAELSTESGTMSFEQIEAELRRPDLDPNTARTLKLRIESLRGMVKYQAEMGKLVSRAEVEEYFVRMAMAMQSFLRRYEREIPAICLGLSLSQSTPLVKAKTREMQDHLADLESEFWKDHPEQ